MDQHVNFISFNASFGHAMYFLINIVKWQTEKINVLVSIWTSCFY
jgi:hypothetical protein